MKYKIEWLSDKELRCKNCKHFKLYVDKYETKNEVLIKCVNCDASFICNREFGKKLINFNNNK